MMMMIGSARVDNPTVTVRFRRLVIVEPREAADADEHGAEDENGNSRQEERAEGDLARHYSNYGVAGNNELVQLNLIFRRTEFKSSRSVRFCDPLQARDALVGL